MTIVWSIVPYIRSVTDINFCHFGPFFALLHPLTTWKIKILQKWKKHLEISLFYTFVPSDNHMMYGSWNKEYNRKFFLSFWTVFCPFTPLLTTQTIKILKRWKKTPGDIIILHMCTINDNHMIYGSWDMEHNSQNFLSFWTIVCSFTLLTMQKIKNF